MKIRIIKASTLAVLAISTLGFTQQAQSQCRECTNERDACLKDCSKSIIDCDKANAACIAENADKGCAGPRTDSKGETTSCG